MAAMIHQIAFDRSISLQNYFLDKIRASLGIVVRNNKAPTGYFRLSKFCIERSDIEDWQADLETLDLYLRD
jgi:hypothetical protein